tara:strand:- start:391 stop:648 length:258 start_codon:yes stop_codon:yes gene_type:complete
MDLINFYNFVSQTESEEILSARLVEKDEIIKAHFYINRDIDLNHGTKHSDDDFLKMKYKGLVDLYLLKQNLFQDNKKEIVISIKP